MHQSRPSRISNFQCRTIDNGEWGWTATVALNRPSRYGSPGATANRSDAEESPASIACILWAIATPAAEWVLDQRYKTINKLA
jgi:hypothetical protein